MPSLLEIYAKQLVDENSAMAGSIAISSQNDTVSSFGPALLSDLTNSIIRRLDCTAVIAAKPRYPFSCFLLQHAPHDISALVPNDSESRSFLHDIPLVRKKNDSEAFLDDICKVLSKRKGCIVEGTGIICHGSLTIEQAYISWSSIHHATTIKYFEDLLKSGQISPEEIELLEKYQADTFRPFNLEPFEISHTVPTKNEEIIEEIIKTGKATVRLGLVDSFFGNISCITNDALYISKTSARLDELSGQIDAVRFDGSSTAGITASSELPAHLAIAKSTGCRVILHGHPRFSVIMSFFSVPGEHEGIDLIDSIPVVDGEGGAGGIAKTLPIAFCLTGARAIIVRGHGVFSISDTGFEETLAVLAQVELFCRERYFSLLAARCNF